MREKARYAFGLVLASMALAILAAPAVAVASSTPPTITAEGVSLIGTNSATLEATIDLGSSEAGTYYQFQIAEDPGELAEGIQCPPNQACNGPQSEAALPIQSISGETEQTIKVGLRNAYGVLLKPGRTYYYRVLVANAVATEETIEWEEPTVFGEIKSFTTKTGIPAITAEGASQITATDATLEATIDPGASTAGTYFQFQIAEDPNKLPGEMQCPPDRVCNGPQSSVALSIRAIRKEATIKRDLTKEENLTLKPGTTYYYRVVAANAIFSEDIIEWEEPTVFGEIKSFTTEAVAPTITAEGASQITATDATLEATIDPGSQEGAYYQFQIAKDPSEFAEEFQCPPLGSPFFMPCSGGVYSETALPVRHDRTLGESTVEFDLAKAEVTLEPGTTYYYRVLAANAMPTEDTIEWEEPTVFGETESFTTETEAPAITAESATAITATGATLKATLDPGSSQAGTYSQFEIAEDPSEFAEEMQCPPPPSSGPFIACIGTESATALPIDHISREGGEAAVGLDLAEAGVVLEPGTTYYYRVLAANAVPTEDTIEWEEPTVFGETKSFTTETEAPAITAESASQITTGNAVLKATLDPGSSQAGTYYQFQIAKDPGEFAEEMQSTGLPIGHVALEAGETTVELDLAKAGVPLKPGTTYHFRVLAANAVPTEDTIEWEEPTVFGKDQTFTTSVDPPTSDPEEGPVVPPPPAPEPEPPHHHHHHHHRHVGNHHAGLFWARVAP